jgi:asparagine synthase (glutamine-hydrolysing)
MMRICQNISPKWYFRFWSTNEINELEELRSELQIRLSNDLLMRSDRATMASSLELRTPFLTSSVLAFANTFKLNKLLSFKQTKIPLKSELLKDFDRNFVFRNKVGFDMDVQFWLDSELKPEIDQFLNSKNIKGINYSGLKNLVEQRKNPAMVWAWLTLEKWNQRWVI